MLTSRDVVVFGAGGHSKVVIDLLQKNDRNVLKIIDPNQNGDLFDIPIHATIDSIDLNNVDVIVAIGDNAVRKTIVSGLGESMTFIKSIHPSATIGRDVELRGGTVVMAGVVINPSVVIGRHTIVNTGATIDHDCIIEDYCHIAPGVNLCGNVNVGAGSLIGVGASVVPGVTIGQDAKIGAGAVVIDDVPSGAIVKGVPAR